MPDHLICMGEYFLDLFAAHGIPRNKMSIGGALHFPRTNDDVERKVSSNSKKIALCSTSIKLSESLDLAFKSFKAVQSVAGIRLIVNFHPVVDEQFKQTLKSFLKDVAEDYFDCIEFSEAPSRSLLSKVDILLYNTSGAAFDALNAGKPAVFVPVDGNISYNKVPSGLAVEVRNTKDFQDVLMSVVKDENTGIFATQNLEIEKCLGTLNPEIFVSAVTK
ncbi:MAG: hypothetical protein JKY92_06355 [Magnetovibrio sp.]|nr:hypothetical protein [Magnetovibrio sp.]